MNIENSPLDCTPDPISTAEEAQEFLHQMIRVGLDRLDAMSPEEKLQLARQYADDANPVLPPES
ncbi:MAG: hypothetical protein ACO3RV_01000 [Luteolibacter sp.]